jgi:tetratricopeptide (TPR) repeat protein
MKKVFHCLIITITFFLIFFTASAFAKTMNILVHPFENTGNKEYSWISAGMTDTFIADLSRIKSISVVSNTDRKKILEEMKFVFPGLAEEDKMIKLGKLTGADVIFTGNYLVSGNEIRVHARLVNVESGKIESTAKVDGTLSGIFDLQDQVIFNLMEETRKIQIADIKTVKLTLEDRKTIGDKPKPKADAYQWYAKGLERQEIKPEEALTNFKKALDIDPNYTPALIRAGVTAGYTLNLFSEALMYLEKAGRVLRGRSEINTTDYAILMGNLGNVYNSKGQLDRALECYLNSQSTQDMLGLQNTAYYAILMGNLGNVYYLNGQLDLALKYFLKSQSIQDGLGLQNTIDYASLINSIGIVYWSKGQLDRASEYYLISQSMQDRLGLQNTAIYAALMTNLGIIYRDKAKPDLALEYFLKSQSIRDRLGLQNTAIYATLMTNIGIVYWSKDQHDRALECYLFAQSIRDRLGLQNTAIYAALMTNIGIVYWSKDQRDRALEYYLNSKSIRDRLGLQNTAGYAGLMSNIGNVYNSKNQLDLALKYSLHSKSIRNRLGLQNTAGYAGLMSDIGNIYNIMAQRERALEYYTNSQSIQDRLGLQNTVDYAHLLLNIGTAYWNEGRADRAGKYYRMAYNAYVKADYSGLGRDKALKSAERLGY